MRILFALSIHTELYRLPDNIPYLANEVMPLLYSKYGVKPTFAIQVEPKECSDINLFRDFPKEIEKLSEYGEIALHSHWKHNRSPEHQELHIVNALKEGNSYKPKVWVSGDWLTDVNTLKILEGRMPIDSSILVGRIEVGHTWRSPRAPYYPGLKNIHKPTKGKKFKILEIPNAPRLNMMPEMEISRLRYRTEEHIKYIIPYRKDAPIVVPIHSYNFLERERYWCLLGYLLWLTENYDVKMVTISDFLQYAPLKQEEHRFSWRDVVRDILGKSA
ncbi:MAG: hypothetical protein H3Z50_00430 [archaeon]|nr:hypothetical protein [archaeon]MCP8305677.1 hypothetical protein [archaeon]